MIKSLLREVENVNRLPSYIEMNEITSNEKIKNYWNSKKTIVIGDGTNVELSSNKKCILHFYNDFKAKLVYKIGDNLYQCSHCMTLLKERKNLATGYAKKENFLFPKNWTDTEVTIWVNKFNKREEHRRRKKRSKKQK